MRPDTAGVHRRARVMAQSHVAPHCGATNSAPQTQSVSWTGGHGHRYTLTNRRHSHSSLHNTTAAYAMDSPPPPSPPILGSSHDATTGALVGSEIPGGSAPSAGPATEDGPCLRRPRKRGRRPAECAAFYIFDKRARQMTCRACMVRMSHQAGRYKAHLALCTKFKTNNADGAGNPARASTRRRR